MKMTPFQNVQPNPLNAFTAFPREVSMKIEATAFFGVIIDTVTGYEHSESPRSE
jgi:hypothetical protein